jgi:hypothetical protein
VVYDEINSSRMIDEEIEALILQKPGGPTKDQPDSDSDDGDVNAVGTHVEKYTGCKLSPHKATNWWMEWDAASHM